MFSCPFVCLVFIYIYSVSYLLPSKLDFPSQHGGEDHLQVHPEGIILQVIEVQSHLVGPDDFVVVALRIIDLRQQLLFVAVFQ